MWLTHMYLPWCVALKYFELGPGRVRAILAGPSASRIYSSAGLILAVIPGGGQTSGACRQCLAELVMSSPPAQERQAHCGHKGPSSQLRSSRARPPSISLSPGLIQFEISSYQEAVEAPIVQEEAGQRRWIYYRKWPCAGRGAGGVLLNHFRLECLTACSEIHSIRARGKGGHGDWASPATSFLQLGGDIQHRFKTSPPLRERAAPGPSRPAHVSVGLSASFCKGGSCGEMPSSMLGPRGEVEPRPRSPVLFRTHEMQRRVNSPPTTSAVFEMEGRVCVICSPIASLLVLGASLLPAGKVSNSRNHDSSSWASSCPRGR